MHKFKNIKEKGLKGDADQILQVMAMPTLLYDSETQEVWVHYYIGTKKRGLQCFCRQQKQSSFEWYKEVQDWIECIMMTCIRG